MHKNIYDTSMSNEHEAYKFGKVASLFYVDRLGGRGGQKNAYFTK